jgi:hypothetical protein
MKRSLYLLTLYASAVFCIAPGYAQSTIRAAAVGIDSILLTWDSVDSGPQYKVYYNTENNPNTARASGNPVSTNNTTLVNLVYNSTYYIWVSALEGGVESAKSPVVTAALPETRLGQPGPGGGIIFYDKGNTTDGWRYLEAAPADLGSGVQWGAYEKTVGRTGTVVGSGKRNTQVIVERLRQLGESGRAAQLCTQYRGGGLSDWFLPSKDELDLMYKNLKAKGLGNFGSGWCWSSSAYDNSDAWAQRFSDGSQGAYLKYKANSVRAVRAFNP